MVAVHSFCAAAQRSRAAPSPHALKSKSHGLALDHKQHVLGSLDAARRRLHRRQVEARRAITSEEREDAWDRWPVWDPEEPPFGRHDEDEDETQIVPYGESIAIGTEATRSYGGPEAVFAMLYTARSEAAKA